MHSTFGGGCKCRAATKAACPGNAIGSMHPLHRLAPEVVRTCVASSNSSQQPGTVPVVCKLSKSSLQARSRPDGWSANAKRAIRSSIHCSGSDTTVSTDCNSDSRNSSSASNNTGSTSGSSSSNSSSDVYGSSSCSSNTATTPSTSATGNATPTTATTTTTTTGSSNGSGSVSSSGSITGVHVSRRQMLGCTGAVLLNPTRQAQAMESPSEDIEGSGTLQDNDRAAQPPRSRRPLPAVRKVLLRPPPPPASRKGKRATSQIVGGNGVRVSRVMKGCWQLGGAHRGDQATDHTSGAAAMKDFDTFMNAGITTINTSDVWGPSEAVVGNWLRLYPWWREQVQLVTHLTIGAEELERLSPELLAYRVRASLARMGATSLDLVLLQWEESLDARSPQRGAGLVDAALWLADLQGQGLVNAIGVSNLDAPHLLQVLDAGVPVTCNEVSYSVLDRRPELYLQHVAPQRGVQLIATGTMAGGWLSKKWLGRPASRAALDTLSKAKYGAWLKEAGGWQWMQEMLQTLASVGSRHHVSPSAVALAWVLQQPGVAAAAVGARNAAHVRDIQSAFTFHLDDEDMLALEAAYEGCPHPPTSDVFAWERGGTW